MKIAFISYEFPTETGGGGIGTYLQQVAPALAMAGHSVEVFAGGNVTTSHRESDRLMIHRITCPASPAFAETVVPHFAAVHRDRPFDVVEGCDFDASAVYIKRLFPELPYVCKLHTPRFAVDELHYKVPGWFDRMRIRLGALRRGRRPPAFSAAAVRRAPGSLLELESIMLADVVAAPSQAIADAALNWIPACADRLDVFPYPYVPATSLLDIPAGGTTNRITCLGRLEERKGVIDLADAIPLVLERFPLARFQFVGKSMPHGPSGIDMREFLGARLGRHAAAVDFPGPQPPGEIPGLLARSDILAAPSHWESFGLVCCEGLAAARAVLGSANGGMAEILGDGQYGVLVQPHQPEAIARALLDLLTNPARRQALGEAGRQHVIAHFSVERIIAAQTASYQRAIAQVHSFNK